MSKVKSTDSSTDSKTDISKVTGGSGRKIYDTSQALVKAGELDPKLALTRKNQMLVPPEYIYRDDTYNVREALNPVRVRMFADRFKAGLFVPSMIVKAIQGRFKVIEGHHRHAGLELALSEGTKIHRLEVNEFEGDENEAVLLMMNSAEGERLTALEKAGAYKRLERQGMSIEEIAAARNQSTVQIKKMLMLANAPLEVKRAVREGKIKATPAIEILMECERTGEDPVAMLTSAQHQAQKLGKASVTGKAIKAASTKPAALPRKHVTAAIGTLLGSSITNQLRAALPASIDASTADVPLTLPANVARELFEALAKLEEAKAAAEASPKDAEKSEGDSTAKE